MTKKDYIKLAAALAINRPPANNKPDTSALLSWWLCVSSIADVLQADNQRFDRRRFLTACGVSQ